MLKKFLALSLATMMGVTLLAGCGPKAVPETKEEKTEAKEETAATDGETIKIGAIGPLTGNVSQYGIAVINGITQYVEEVNANGGINGKKIDLLIQDEKGEPTEALNAYDKLVANDKIVALIGDVTSKPSIVVAERAAEDNLPMITASGTAKEITEAGPNVFRACFIDPFQGEVMANFASKKLGAKTAAVLHNSAQDYSVGVAQAFVNKCSELGIEVVKNEAYGDNDSDFKSQLTNILTAKPDVLFIPDYYNNIALIASQAKEIGMTSILLGVDGWDGVLNVSKDPSTLEGAYFCNHYSAQDENAELQAFLKKYKERFGEDANAFAALGYDAAKIMITAIEKAGSTDSNAIIAQLTQTNMAGITGSMTFDANRNPIKEASILTIKNGEYQFFERFGVN